MLNIQVKCTLKSSFVAQSETSYAFWPGTMHCLLMLYIEQVLSSLLVSTLGFWAQVGGAEIYRNRELDTQKRIYPGGVFGEHTNVHIYTGCADAVIAGCQLPEGFHPHAGGHGLAYCKLPIRLDHLIFVICAWLWVKIHTR